jgi:hypothetical protein
LYQAINFNQSTGEQSHEDENEHEGGTCFDPTCKKPQREHESPQQRESRHYSQWGLVHSSEAVNVVAVERDDSSPTRLDPEADMRQEQGDNDVEIPAALKCINTTMQPGSVISTLIGCAVSGSE